MAKFRPGDIVSVVPHEEDDFFPSIGTIQSCVTDTGETLYIVVGYEDEVYTVTEKQLEFAKEEEK